MPRQPFADIQAGHPGMNRPEWAAKLRRHFRFQVIGVQVARPPVQPDQNTGRISARPICRRGPILQPQQIRQPQAAQSRNAGPQKLAAADHSRVPGLSIHDNTLS